MTSYIDWDHPLGITRRVWCHLLASAFAFMFVAPLTFMALDRADPVAIHSTRLSGEFKSGGLVKVTWEATAIRQCEGEVRRRLIDQSGVVFEFENTPTVIRSESEFGRRTYVREFTLPKSIAAGRATYHTVVRYYCNPLHSWLNFPIVVSRQSEPITITE
jgi:hypothetical protein